LVLLVGIAILLSGLPSAPAKQGGKVGTLFVGATFTITGQAVGPREKAGRETMRRFIREETGLSNEVTLEKDWLEATGKLKKGELHVGVFQGYEYAWALEQAPELKPLVIAINVHRTPLALLLVKRDNPAKDFTGLAGQSLTLATTNQNFLRLYLERECAALGKKTDTFFSKIATPDSVEDALDDVVDGKSHATLIDQATLDAYQRRKPGRAKQLREAARSKPFPPAVVAHHGTTLDDATLNLLKRALLGASRKETGELLLTMSRLTNFEPVPENFNELIAQSRKDYPPPGVK
jgi:ABC-type phosphate/phosphonate transport system substrate-binding protein